MRRFRTTIGVEQLDTSARILRALAHPLRMKILEFIDQNEEINVNKIYSSLNLEQSITSQHLRVLRAEGLVITKREGKFINYSIDYSVMDKVQKALALLKNEDRHRDND